MLVMLAFVWRKMKGHIINTLFLREGMIVVKLDRKRIELTFKTENSL